MSSSTNARSTSRHRPEVVRVLHATEARRDRVLDGIRKFLEDHAMQGKTGAREFYDFEKSLHERLLQAEREIVGTSWRRRTSTPMPSRSKAAFTGGFFEADRPT